MSEGPRETPIGWVVVEDQGVAVGTKFVYGSNDDEAMDALMTREDAERLAEALRERAQTGLTYTVEPVGGSPRETLEGVALIAAERARQVDAEGWSPEHDDGHTDGILPIAAAELAVDGTDAHVVNPLAQDLCGSLAKFGFAGTKPDRVRALTIAGALIAAEIDRELRAALLYRTAYRDGGPRWLTMT